MTQSLTLGLHPLSLVSCFHPKSFFLSLLMHLHQLWPSFHPTLRHQRKHQDLEHLGSKSHSLDSLFSQSPRIQEKVRLSRGMYYRTTVSKSSQGQRTIKNGGRGDGEKGWGEEWEEESKERLTSEQIKRQRGDQEREGWAGEKEKGRVNPF